MRCWTRRSRRLATSRGEVDTRLERPYSGGCEPEGTAFRVLDIALRAHSLVLSRFIEGEVSGLIWRGGACLTRGG